MRNDATNSDHSYFKHLISAPTISDANEWMREVKGLHVSVDAIHKTCYYCEAWNVLESYCNHIPTPDSTYDTNDLAAEAGLIAGLEWMGKEVKNGAL